MADLNARIKPKKSSAAGEVPQSADLEVAEIAVNTADGKLFVKHTDNSIKEISGGTDITTESIDALSDVDTSTTPPTDGQVLTWVDANSQWEPADAAAGGATTLDELTDVQTSPTSVVWNGTAPDDAIGGMVTGTCFSNNSALNVHPTDSNGYDTSALMLAWVASLTLSTPVTLIVDGVEEGSTRSFYSFTDNSASTGDYNPRFIIGISPSDVTLADGKTISIKEFNEYVAANGGPMDADILAWSSADSKWTLDRLAPPVTAIDGLTDVDTSTTAPTNGQVLAWDGNDSKWEPATVDTLTTPIDLGGLTDVTTSSGADASFASVSLLAEGDAFTDSSSNSLTLTNSGTVALETGITKFGGGSYNFTAGGGVIDVAYNTALDISSGDWTTEMWIYPPVTPSGVSELIAFNDVDPFSEHSWRCRMASGMDYLQLVWTPTGSASTELQWSTQFTALTTNTWHHVAWQRNGTQLEFFVNGTRVSTHNKFSGQVTGQNLSDTTIGGAREAGTIVRTWPGYIEGVRVTKGVARYTGATYTVPTEAFPTSSTAIQATDGKVLTYVGSASRWEPATLQGSSVRTALGIGEYADDTAAGTGGVASGALYYNTTNSNYVLKS